MNNFTIAPTPNESGNTGAGFQKQMNLLRLRSGENVHVQDLGLSNEETQYSADVSRIGKFLGAGGEKAGFEYTDSQGNPMVIAIEHPAKSARHEAALFPVSVAMNARLANYVSDPAYLTDLVNYYNAQQAEMGLKGYHYLLLKERFPGQEAITPQHLATLNGFIKAISGGKPLHPETFRYAHPDEFEGGLLGYINYLADHFKSLNPNLLIGNKVFPDIYLYGVFDEDTQMSRYQALRVGEQARAKGRDFNPDLSGRPYTTMEKYDHSLDQIIDANLDYISQGRSQTDRFRRMRDVVSGNFPIEAFQQIIVNMNVVHLLGFSFGDLKLPNLAFQGNGKNRKGLIADPGLVKTGEQVMFASPAYLPEGNFTVAGQARNPRVELDIGKLRAAPELDNYAMGVIRKAVFEGFDDPYAFDAFLKEYKELKSAERSLRL